MGVEAVSVGVKKCIPMHSDEAIRLELSSPRLRRVALSLVYC